MGGVEQLAPRLGFPKALVVPHAGYIYSGPVAARAYATSRPRAASSGASCCSARCTASRCAASRCPAARVLRHAARQDSRRSRRRCASSPRCRRCVGSAPAHAMEHSLEVQLPFLQKALGDVRARSARRRRRRARKRWRRCSSALWGGPETLIVVSHRPVALPRLRRGARDRRRDHRAHRRASRPDIDHEEACGATPLNGLAAPRAGRRTCRSSSSTACNSGDTAGGKGRVVGYSSFALHDAEPTSRSTRPARTLLAIARKRDRKCARQSEKRPPKTPPGSTQAGATFVTLHQDGALRGCIGSLRGGAARSASTSRRTRSPRRSAIRAFPP